MVVEPPGDGVRLVRLPVDRAATLLPRPLAHRADEGGSDPVPAGSRVGEEVLEVAEVRLARAGVHEEVGDPDELPVEPGAEPVQAGVSGDLQPRRVVCRLAELALVEGDVGAEQRLPPTTVRGLEAPGLDHGPTVARHLAPDDRKSSSPGTGPATSCSFDRGVRTSWRRPSWSCGSSSSWWSSWPSSSRRACGWSGPWRASRRAARSHARA